MTSRKFATLAVMVILSALLYRHIAPHPLDVFSSSAPTVVVDPGHGSLDPGVVHEESGLAEAPINLAVAYKLKDALSQQKMNPVLTRDKHTQELDGNRRELSRRVKLASDAKADIYVSLHVNQFPDPQYFGAQCFYHPSSEEGKRLALLIQEELKALDPENFREALAQDLFVLRECSMPAVVVEMGFISNPRDRERLQDPLFQDKIAQGVARGIDRFFKGEAPTRTPEYH